MTPARLHRQVRKPGASRWLALLAAVSIAACAAPPRAPGSTAIDTASAIEVAAGVYMLRGAPGEASVDNAGRVGNAGFIVGPQGVLAIDSGTSYRQGKAMLAAIAAVTDKPVRLLLLSHTRQEFLMGAAAFRERGIPVQMQRRAANLMAARCERCLQSLQRLLGSDEMQGTEVLVPDRLFDEPQLLSLIGRPVRLLYFGHSSGPGDTAVFDETSGTLFAGGLLDEQRIPDVQDSDLAGWGRALAALQQLRPRRIVAGHGPVGGADTIAAVQRYLSQLQAGAAALLDSGASLSEVPERLRLPAFEGWDQYDTVHRRNSAVVFLRLEQEQLLHEGGS